VAEVLTSSGHGGSFSFGIKNRKQLLASAQFIDLVLDMTFRSDPDPRLRLLPAMNVSFSSERMVIATISVRGDMAVALVKTFARHYD
jgi:hypothetical protein